MASKKKLTANRKNAKKSSGPKNTSLTRLNALKHGLLSKEVLIEGEKKKDLEELGKRLRQQLAPQGELEVILVDRMISSVWRLKRALKVESALMSWRYEDGLKTWDGRPRDEREACGDMLTLKNDDKVLRYETTIERQIYRALHELIRLQAARKGEKPPAPIAVDVDVNKERELGFV